MFKAVAGTSITSQAQVPKLVQVEGKQVFTFAVCPH